MLLLESPALHQIRRVIKVNKTQGDVVSDYTGTTDGLPSYVALQYPYIDISISG